MFPPSENVMNSSNIVNHSSEPPQQQMPTQMVVANSYRPEIIQPTFLPMALTVQQQYHQLQIQQQQQAAAVLAHHQQQQQTLQTVVQSKPYRKNTVLELQKIPAHLNNIVQLSEFFQKFGCITRVQTPYNNDNQAALIEFSQYQEATAAYNCPDA